MVHSVDASRIDIHKIREGHEAYEDVLDTVKEMMRLAQKSGGTKGMRKFKRGNKLTNAHFKNGIKGLVKMKWSDAKETAKGGAADAAEDALKDKFNYGEVDEGDVLEWCGAI